MNIIRMTGGLGNQMFEYALFLKFQKEGIEVKFDDFTEYDNRDNFRPIKLDVFGIDYPKATKEEFDRFTDSYMDLGHRIARKIRGRKSFEYHEVNDDFDSEILKKDGCYLTGYFQSEKYFEDIKEDVVKAFTFTDEAVAETKKICPKIMELLDALSNTTDFVSIHIRRGDYLNVADEFGNICNDSYYDRAVRYISETVTNPHFLVFSNDDEWTADFIRRYDGRFNMTQVSGISEDNGFAAMYLMSRCRHHIIANSSFSWWGSYLSKNKPGDPLNRTKKIVAPTKWTNSKAHEGIFTEDMIRI